MSGRADAFRSPRGEPATFTIVALSVASFLVAAVLVFLTVMWGESGPGGWGVLVGILVPTAMTLLAAVVLTANLIRVRPARVAAIGRRAWARLRAAFGSTAD